MCHSFSCGFARDGILSRCFHATHRLIRMGSFAQADCGTNKQSDSLGHAHMQVLLWFRGQAWPLSLDGHMRCKRCAGRISRSEHDSWDTYEQATHEWLHPFRATRGRPACKSSPRALNQHDSTWPDVWLAWLYHMFALACPPCCQNANGVQSRSKARVCCAWLLIHSGRLHHAAKDSACSVSCSRSRL